MFVRVTTKPTVETNAAFARVRIQPDSDQTRKQSLLQSREIDCESFTIGRRGSRRYIDSEKNLPDFIVANEYPFTVSRFHCEIVRTENGVWVRDLKSRMGTIVNDKRLLCKEGYDSEVFLGNGTHRLELGRRGGGVRFRIVVSDPPPQST